ncbi:hypothetical protein [Salinispora arenicola]|uniref:hypothetical protein n=1 Tax=Salinispora arenicola TaxID=168697 RepID=UPI0027DB4F8E|nr:hypothetical protein [Salinispora arenicola]
MTRWLIDKSAYVRLHLDQTANRDEWSVQISRGLVRLPTVTRLELGYSAPVIRNADSSQPHHCP